MTFFRSPLRSDAEVAGGPLLWMMLILLLFVPSLFWILHDESVWPWDTASYGELAITLYAALQRSFHEWVRMLFTIMPGRMPGTVWLGEFFVPLGLWLHSIPRALLFCNLLIQLTGIYLLFYILVELFHSRLTALVTTALVSSGPLYVGMTTSYFTEPFQGLGIVLVLYSMMKADRMPLLRSASLFALGTLVAIIGKVSAPLYVICPAVFILLVFFWRRSEWRKSLRIGWVDFVLISLFCAGALVAGWYLFINYNDLRSHVSAASASEAYGHRAGVIVKLRIWFRQFAMAYFHPVTYPFVAAGVPLTIWALFRRKSRWDWADRIALVSLLQMAFTILSLCFAVNDDGRFIFCLFPYFGIVICWILSRVGNHAVTVLYGLLAFTQLTLVAAQQHGIVAPNERISPYVLAIDTKGQNMARVMRALEITCTAENAGRISVIGVEFPYFNADSISFYSTISALSHGRKCGYTNLGPGGTTVEAAWRNLYRLDPVFVVFLEEEIKGIGPNDPLNGISQPVLDRVRASADFQRLTVAAWPDIGLFKPKDRCAWHIESAYLPGAKVWTEDGSGTGWHIHPSPRRAASQMIVRFTAPLPRDAILSGSVERCDSRCAGVALTPRIEGQPAAPQPIRLGPPVQSKKFSAQLHNAAGSKLSILVESLDPQNDTVDNCWLTLADVRIDAAQ